MQSFKEEPTYTEVNPGENTELRCVVNDIGGECRWQKDGKVSGRTIKINWLRMLMNFGIIVRNKKVMDVNKCYRTQIYITY